MMDTTQHEKLLEAARCAVQAELDLEAVLRDMPAVPPRLAGVRDKLNISIKLLDDVDQQERDNRAQVRIVAPAREEVSC